MAIIKSSKKSIKSSKKRYETNLTFKNAMKKSIKVFLKSLNDDSKKDDMSNLLKLAQSSIDKAAKKGIIKKQTASRKKSRLAKKM